jgi:hypothetical protein
MAPLQQRIPTLSVIARLIVIFAPSFPSRFSFLRCLLFGRLAYNLALWWLPFGNPVGKSDRQLSVLWIRRPGQGLREISIAGQQLQLGLARARDTLSLGLSFSDPGERLPRPDAAPGRRVATTVGAPPPMRVSHRRVMHPTGQG